MCLLFKKRSHIERSEVGDIIAEHFKVELGDKI